MGAEQIDDMIEQMVAMGAMARHDGEDLVMGRRRWQRCAVRHWVDQL